MTNDLFNCLKEISKEPALKTLMQVGEIRAYHTVPGERFGYELRMRSGFKTPYSCLY